MGRLNKIKSFFSFILDFLTISSHKAIVFVLLSSILILAILPTSILHNSPNISVNRHIFSRTIGNFIECPTDGFLEYCCPSCGLTRATSYALKGNVQRAWFHNPLIFLILPLVFILIAYHGKKVLEGE